MSASSPLQLQAERYAPGERLEGRIATEAGRRLRVRLLWYTEGKGSRDVHTVAARELDAGAEHFSFDLPESPYSFSGTLISLVWAVEVEDVERGDAVRQTFVMSADREEVRLPCPEQA